MDDNMLMEVNEVTDWFWDTSKGSWLEPGLVMEARKKEIEYVRRMNIYDEVPREEAKMMGN